MAVTRPVAKLTLPRVSKAVSNCTICGVAPAATVKAPALLTMMCGCALAVTRVPPKTPPAVTLPLAVTTPRRVGSLPDLPTMTEAGLPGYAITLWIAMFGPAGMPPAVTARLNQEINRVLTLSEVRDQMTAQGSEVTPGAPADLLAAVKTDLKRMGEIVKAAKIQPE